MNPVLAIQITVTLVAILLGVLHIFCPSISIDAVTLTLFGIAVIPWLAPLFKAIEFPGGWKFEFHELEQLKKKAEEAGLLTEDHPSSEYEYAFLSVVDADPHLALAGFRIELEKSLRELAERSGVELEERSGVVRMMRQLEEREILSKRESMILADIMGTLNRAVHGHDVDKRAVDWVLDVAPGLLESISTKQV